MSTNDSTPDPTAGERIAAGRIAHGVGSSDYLPGNVQHLVSPIVGILRRLQRDGEPLPATEMEWVIDRLMLTLDFAREHDAAGTPASEGLADRDEARRELADLRAKVAEMRAGIWRLGESIHGDEGVEHVEGCEGEPTCFACILARLRALLPTEDDQ